MHKDPVVKADGFLRPRIDDQNRATVIGAAQADARCRFRQGPPADNFGASSRECVAEIQPQGDLPAVHTPRAKCSPKRGPHEKIPDCSLFDCSCHWRQWMRWQSPGGKR